MTKKEIKPALCLKKKNPHEITLGNGHIGRDVGSVWSTFHVDYITYNTPAYYDVGCKGDVV